MNYSKAVGNIWRRSEEALSIRNAFVNQPVQESSLRPEFARDLGLVVRRFDLVVRYGREKEMPRSLRRQVESVLV